MRALVTAGAVALALAAAACGGQRDRATAPSRLVDLQSVAQLRTEFVRDAGHPRVLLLLSPT